MINIGSDIVIRVIKTGKGSVKLGIEAPASVRVRRAELASSEVPQPAMESNAESHLEADMDSVMEFELDECGELEECTLEALLVQN
jgi:carbon storage regulator CsrA